MAIKKKKTEIQRLISEFARAADKCKEITFSIFFINENDPINTIKLISPNQKIMLYKYYGEIEPDINYDSDKLIQELNTSDFQLDLNGANFSAFAVIEGEDSSLFCQMAEKAGNIFNQKESSTLQLLVVDDILEAKKDVVFTPVVAVNSNVIAIWLNYLLYYISMLSLGSERVRKVELNPFYLSLLALEDLLETQKINKVSKDLS